MIMVNTRTNAATLCQYWAIAASVMTGASVLIGLILAFALLLGIHSIPFSDAVAFTQSGYILLILTTLATIGSAVIALASCIVCAILLERAK